MTTPDPRIEPLAQAAARHSETLPEMDYYRAAAREFLAFDDALAALYLAPDNVGQIQPLSSLDTREERARTHTAIHDRIGRALRLARKETLERDTGQAGAFIAIAMELQSLLDSLA